jgi:hypothetical protein
MAGNEEFSPEEWRTLQFAPFWVLCVLLGRYRDFDELDLAAFSSAVQSAVTGHGRLTHDVLESVAADLDMVRLRFELDSRSIVKGLYDVTVILRRTPPEQAELFKEALISEVGAGVARARGRYGRVISEDDERTLALTTAFLSAEDLDWAAD